MSASLSSKSWDAGIARLRGIGGEELGVIIVDESGEGLGGHGWRELSAIARTNIAIVRYAVTASPRLAGFERFG